MRRVIHCDNITCDTVQLGDLISNFLATHHSLTLTLFVLSSHLDPSLAAACITSITYPLSLDYLKQFFYSPYAIN